MTDQAAIATMAAWFSSGEAFTKLRSVVHAGYLSRRTIALAPTSAAAVFAATGAGFMDTYPRKLWQQRLQLIPDPYGKVFAGWILEAGQIVQIVMIQSFIDWLEDLLDLAEVPDPAGMGVHLAFKVNRNPERVPV
jgi:hypothetical protein